MSNGITPHSYMESYGIQLLFKVRYRNSEDSPFLRAIKTKTLKNERLILSHISKAVEECEGEFLTGVFRHAEDVALNLRDIPFWRSPIKNISETLHKESASAYSIYNGSYDYAITAASMVPGFEWDKLFDKVLVIQSSNNYIRHSYKKILQNYSSNFAEPFKDYVDENIFYSKSKPSFATRGSLYSEYIRQGLLSKKTARKIRSDASEEASLVGLKSLVDSASLYSNYDDLLLQFTDSKYDGVICHLADHLPEYLITSIMGTQSHWGKQRVEARLNKIEADREIAASKEAL